MAAMVLRFEADEHLRLMHEDLSTQPGHWAMIYNVGGDYFRRTYKFAHTVRANRFGRWVSERKSDIQGILRCSVGDYEDAGKH
jgi:hypothetical protein